MKVVVIGAAGQLGFDLCRVLSSEDVVPLNHSEIEITDMYSVKEAILIHKPDVVINTAAFHLIDECDAFQEKAFMVNALGASNVAVVAQMLNAKLVYVSTDYVFGGGDVPHIPSYNEFDIPAPLNVYGKSKLAGEDAVRHICCKHFIIRVSGLFGIAGSSGKGGNFVETMLKLAKERNELRVINDQYFCPTYTYDLAQKIAQLISTEYYGIFHITNRGICSWYEFTVEILKQAGIKTPVIPITSKQYLQKTKRPSFSALDNYHLRLLGMDDMRSWQDALTGYMREKGHLE